MGGCNGGLQQWGPSGLVLCFSGKKKIDEKKNLAKKILGNFFLYEKIIVQKNHLQEKLLVKVTQSPTFFFFLHMLFPRFF